MSSYQDKVRKGLITGVVAATASTVVFGQTGNTNIFGITVPTVAAIGGANALASVAADVAHDYVLPYIPFDARFQYAESALLGLGVAGGSTAFILNKENLGSASTMNAFLLGAGSYAAGDWIDSKVKGSSMMLF